MSEFKFQDTFEDNAYVSRRAYQKAGRDGEQAEKEGYAKVPEWFPVPLKGYEYKIFGQMDRYMKPKPKLRHILRYKFVPGWWIKWQAKRFIRQGFKR